MADNNDKATTAVQEETKEEATKTYLDEVTGE